MNRRQHGTGNLRLRDSGRWQSQVRHPRTGKMATRTWPAGTGRRDAERLHRAWLVDLDHHATVNPTITVADWVDRWVEMRADDLSTGSLAVHRRNARRIRATLGAMRLRDLDALAIGAAFRDLGHLSANSIASVKATLGGACRDAVAWHLLHGNPVATVRSPRRQRVERPVPTTEEIHAICAGEPLEHWRVMFECLAGTGCRAGEILGLRWGAVDLTARTLWIDHTLTVDADGRQTIGATTKTGRGRKIAIDEHLTAVLAGWRAALAGRALSHVRPAEPVFPSRRSPSGTLTSASLLVAWRRAMERIGAEDAGYTPHACRHWFASTAIATVPVPILAQHLGMSQSLLLDLYGRHLPADALWQVTATMPRRPVNIPSTDDTITSTDVVQIR